MNELQKTILRHTCELQTRLTKERAAIKERRQRQVLSTKNDQRKLFKFFPFICFVPALIPAFFLLLK